MGNKIKEIYKMLTSDQKSQLKTAHEYSVMSYVRLPDDRFIGVFINGARFLIVEESHNDWAIGRIEYPMAIDPILVDPININELLDKQLPSHSTT